MSKELFSDSGSSVPLSTLQSPEHAGHAEFDLKRFLWLRLPSMLLVFLVLAIPSALAVWFLTPVSFTATADLRFLVVTPKVLDIRESSNTATIPYDKFVNTQIELIKGSLILSRVLDSKDVRALSLIAAEPDPQGFLASRVTANAQKNSELVRLGCEMPTKEAAQIILKAVMDVYIDYALNSEALAGGERMNLLTKERDLRQNELEAQLRQISDMQGALGVPLVGVNAMGTSEGDLYRQNLATSQENILQIEGVQRDIQAQLARCDALSAEFKKSPEKPIFEMGIEDRVNGDVSVSALRTQIASMQAELTSTEKNAQDGLASLEVLKDRVDSLKASLAEFESLARGKAIEFQRADLTTKAETTKTQLAAATSNVERYTKQVEEYTTRMKTATDRFSAIEELKRKTEETRVVLDNVRREISQIGMESKAPARVQRVSEPSVPGEGPDYGRRLKFVLLVLFLSFSVSVGVGVAQEIADQQVRSVRDVARLTSVNAIASIPYAPHDNLPANVDLPLLTVEYPNSRCADEYRRVLAHLLYPDDSTLELKSLVVASPTKGDGKTALACNLALALAQAGRHVLLVDLSFRCPGIEPSLKLPEAEGLGEVLGGKIPLSAATRPTSFDKLDIMGPGFDTEGLGSRLASRAMAAMIESALSLYDHVIFDTAASLIMSDARLVAPLVDGVLIVVGCGISTRGMVQRCVRDLQQVDANLVGIVLNLVRRTPGGYMQRNLDLYTAYEKEATTRRNANSGFGDETYSASEKNKSLE